MKAQQKPLIFDVQRFSLHDGPGIRSTVFFKGCPLRCAWCHNPQSLHFAAEEVYRDALCTHCGCCGEGCLHGARTTVGAYHAPQALAHTLFRDRQLYETSGGGVTFSGGEPLAQDAEYLITLATALKRRGIHLALDTTGYAPWEKIESLLPLVDLWLYDLKLLDEDAHRRYTGVSNAQILHNVGRLSQTGARIWLRIPAVPGVNASEAQMRAMASFSHGNVEAQRVCLLPYHKLGQRAAHFAEPSMDVMGNLAQIWREAGFSNVGIGG